LSAALVVLSGGCWDNLDLLNPLLVLQASNKYLAGPLGQLKIQEVNDLEIRYQQLSYILILLHHFRIKGI